MLLYTALLPTGKLLTHPSSGVSPMLVSTLRPFFTAVMLLPLPASTPQHQTQRDSAIGAVLVG
jgi:hypothetical protein